MTGFPPHISTTSSDLNLFEYSVGTPQGLHFSPNAFKNSRKLRSYSEDKGIIPMYPSPRPDSDTEGTLPISFSGSNLSGPSSPNLNLSPLTPREDEAEDFLRSHGQEIKNGYKNSCKGIIRSLLNLLFILPTDNIDYKRIIELIKNLCSKSDKTINFYVIDYLTKRFPNDSRRTCSLIRLYYSIINEHSSAKILLDNNLGHQIIRRICKCIKSKHVDVIAITLQGLEPYSNNIIWDIVNTTALKQQISQYIKTTIESNLNNWYEEIRIRTRNLLENLQKKNYI